MTNGDELIARLRDSGRRITLARRAICQILADSQGDHVSAPEIYERALATTGGIDRTTVYRTLEELAEVGLVHHVHLSHKPAVYHLSDDHDHHHLVCERCGVTISVPLDKIERALSEVEEQYGFVANGLHFAIVGQCKDCHAQNSARSSGEIGQ